MKSIFFSVLFLFATVSVFAQPTFDLGIKAGVNNSKVTAKASEFTSESIVKTHFGAFARVGWDRIYLQPEAYFSGKGGDLSSKMLHVVTSFDFNTVDVPILFGVKVVKGGLANVRLMTGPVFSFLTSKKVQGDNRFTVQYFKDNYYGFQYGVGVDVWMLTLDARMDYGANNLYNNSSLKGKNQTFLVSLGFKIL